MSWFGIGACDAIGNPYPGLELAHVMSLEIHVLVWNWHILVIGNPRPGLELAHNIPLEMHVLVYNWCMLCHWKSTSLLRTGT